MSKELFKKQRQITSIRLKIQALEEKRKVAGTNLEKFDKEINGLLAKIHSIQNS